MTGFAQKPGSMTDFLCRHDFVCKAGVTMLEEIARFVDRHALSLVGALIGGVVTALVGLVVVALAQAVLR